MDACLEAYNLYYGTPLHVACANDYPDCVKVLLNAGKCITLYIGIEKMYQKTNQQALDF